MPEFADPLFLLLLALPLLIPRIRLNASGTGAALIVPEAIGRKLSAGSMTGTASRLAGWWLPWTVWICLVVAFAGPRQLIANPALPVSGRDLVLALDLSGSMVREDFELDGKRVQRLDAVKHAATEFVRGRAGDRVALVVFASKAYFATPQTYDVAAVAHAIDTASIGIAGRATSISDGLGLALKRLQDSAATSKVVVLLSDGSNNSGAVRPRDAARLARELGVRVHTIALGPAAGEQGADDRDAVDVATLSAIAEISLGETFRVRTTEDLVAVTEAIDRLETDTDDGPNALAYRELWVWPASVAFLLVFGSVALRIRQ